MARNISKPLLKKIIWDKTGGICAHCGKQVSGKAATIDHFIPKSFDGGLDKRNLMPLCKKCNKTRMNRDIDPEEFYIYAPAWALEECLAYKMEWEMLHTTLSGDCI